MNDPRMHLPLVVRFEADTSRFDQALPRYVEYLEAVAAHLPEMVLDPDVENILELSSEATAASGVTIVRVIIDFNHEVRELLSDFEASLKDEAAVVATIFGGRPCPAGVRR